MRTYGDKVYTNSFTVISIDSLLVYDNNYYLQVCLDNWAYKVFTSGFLIIDSNFKILSVMVVMIWQYCVLFLVWCIAITTVEGAGYQCISHGISRQLILKQLIY